MFPYTKGKEEKVNAENRVNFFPKCSWEVICVKIGELQCDILLVAMLEVNSGYAHGSTCTFGWRLCHILIRTQIIYSTCGMRSIVLNISLCFSLSEQLYSIHREKIEQQEITEHGKMDTENVNICKC